MGWPGSGEHSGDCCKLSIEVRQLLAEKIDVTGFMVDFIERYPESVQEYTEYPL